MSLPTASDQLPPPAPWRNISAVRDDGKVIYYAPPTPTCLPLPSIAYALKRHVYSPLIPNAAYIDQPSASIAGLRLLLIVNPHAGKRSPSFLSNTLNAVTEIFREANLVPEIRYTEHARHAIEILQQCGYQNLQQYAAVVSVGGDGTLHQLANGLVAVYEQASAHVNIDVRWNRIPPLAIIPAGSGNALAVSTGLHSHVHAALNIVHSLRVGTAKPLALMQYRRTNSDAPEFSSIGGIQWGLPAEVDQGYDHLRWMGDFRFDLGAVAHILQRRTYNATIRITVHNDKNDQLWHTIDEQRQATAGKRAPSIRHGLDDDGTGTFVLSGSFVQVVAWNSSDIGEGFRITPFAKATETGVFDVIVFKGNLSRIDMVKIFTSVSDGSFMRNTDAYYYFKSTKVVFEELNGQFLTIDGESVPPEPFVFDMSPHDGKLSILDSFSNE